MQILMKAPLPSPIPPPSPSPTTAYRYCFIVTVVIVQYVPMSYMPVTGSQVTTVNIV